MGRAGIRSVTRRRFVARTTDAGHDLPAAPDRPGREFGAAPPGRRWCRDIAYVPTREGSLYPAAAIDPCGRRVAGRSMAGHLRAERCSGAPGMA